MKVNYQETIGESSEELYAMMKEQKNIKNLQKVQVLYRLKSRYNLTVRTCADQMQISQSSINRWLKAYRSGGIEKLLEVKLKTGRPKKIESNVVEGIKNRINQEEGGFNSYKEIQKWIKEEYEQEYAYGTIYDLVHQRWRAKLKVPRPCSIKQDRVAKEEFKKNCVNS
jgi:transposase